MVGDISKGLAGLLVYCQQRKDSYKSETERYLEVGPKVTRGEVCGGSLILAGKGRQDGVGL